MALYAMSDLHLSLSAPKPMDVFGTSWHNYMEKISDNWQRIVTDRDAVVVGGDISWAMYMDEAYEDFKFLNALPGKKYLSRGNHDYWWQTLAKMKAYVSNNKFDTISFIQNDAFIFENKSVAATRGWILPSSDSFGTEDKRIYERELIRLSLACDAMERCEKQNSLSEFERIVVLHYPPISSNGKPDEGIFEVFRKYGIKKCVYGHLHGPAHQSAFCGNLDGIELKLVSADYLKFIPCNLDF